MAATIKNSTGIDQFIEIARHNLIALQANLLELGYEFANSLGAVQLADERSKKAVHSLEQQFGELPVLYRKWYESFRCVDFSQKSSQLRDATGHRMSGLGLNCPLIFLDIDTCVRLRHEIEGHGVRIQNEKGQKIIPFGSAATNCDPKGIWVPDSTMDPIIYDEGAGPVTMAQEVVAAFTAGGFPFWKKMFGRRRFTSPIGVAPAYQEILAALLRNLRKFDIA
jgi:hypothetical protein